MNAAFEAVMVLLKVSVTVPVMLILVVVAERLVHLAVIMPVVPL